MEHSSLPKSFLKNIEMTPNNFYNPENPRHASIANLDIKVILFEMTWRKICTVESWKGSSEESFQLEKIQTVDCRSQLGSFGGRFIVDRWTNDQVSFLVRYITFTLYINCKRGILRDLSTSRI